MTCAIGRDSHTLVDARTLARVTAGPITRQERKQRTRQALLDATLRLLGDRNLAGVSLREVAKEAGIVPTAFYRHFSSMDDLGIALVEECMRTLRTMLRDARTNQPSQSDIIADSVQTLHSQVRAREDHFRFITRERYAGSGPVQSAITTELRLFARELAIDLGRMPEMGEFSVEDLHMMADLIVTAMLGTVMELIDANASDRQGDAEIVRQARKRLRLIVLGVANWRSNP